MKRERSFERILLYLFISIIVPIAIIIINHVYWIDNLLLSVILVSWMGFSLLALQPFSEGEYETIEP